MVDHLKILIIMTEWVQTLHTHYALSKVCCDRRQLFNIILFRPTHHRFFSDGNHNLRINVIIIRVTLYMSCLTLYMRKISLIWSRVMLPLPNLSYSYKKKNTSHFLSSVKRKHLILLQLSSVKGCVGLCQWHNPARRLLFYFFPKKKTYFSLSPALYFTFSKQENTSLTPLSPTSNPLPQVSHPILCCGQTTLLPPNIFL